MKRLLLLALLLSAVTNLLASERKMISRYNKLTGQTAFYPEVSVKDIQQVPLDSLLVADGLQNTIPSRWTLQTTPYRTDTVVITALCVVPGKIITFTATGYTMLLADTANITEWNGLLVRANTPDSSQLILDGFLNVERGDIIKITGLLAEFPTTSMNSVTQFQPIAGISIDIIGSMNVPAPASKSVSDFYTGLFSGGSVRYSTGEPFESMMVELTNLTVDARVNTSRGTFSMVDESGNQITMYDASKYFTLGHGTIIGPADPVWQVKYPVTGQKIDTIRGFITTVSGSENPRGYRIAPVYYGDIVFGIVLPSVTTHRRNPIIVNTDSTADISVRATQQPGGAAISTVELLYSVDGGPLTTVNMTFNASDSTYHGQIPPQAEGSFVSYFVKATDANTNSQILASSAFGGASSDTSKGMFFYKVLNSDLTIQDVQYTPYVNGRTGYLAAVVSVSGVVTADTANIGITALNTGGTSSWYMQAGNTPWSGIWITGPESTMAVIKNGDSITVTGSVAENFDVTRIQNISSVVIHSSGNAVPQPVDVSTAVFGPTIGNGNPGAEQYEGMLVRLTDVTISSIDPVFSDPSEFEVDDASGPVIVRRDGRNNYSNVLADTISGKTILKLNDNISTLTGVIYYSFNRYKIVPRTAADYGVITGIEEIPGSVLPVNYMLSRNYPNPFNPVTKFNVSLPQASYLDITVYNLLGQKVSTLVSEERPAGNYTVTWNATTQNGMPVTSGVYFVRMQAGNYINTQKIVLMK